MTDEPVDVEALIAHRIRDVLMKGTHLPCTECGADRPIGAVLSDNWTLTVSGDRSGTTYTTHKPGCNWHQTGPGFR
jgi:hypothetical protein